MIKHRLPIIAAASTLALVSTIMGLSAIQTDVTDPYIADLRMKYTDEFGVDISSEDPTKNAVITPGHDVPFTPYIENTGSYDTYVFMKLETPDQALVPYELGDTWLNIEDGVYAYVENGVLQALPAKTKNTAGEFTHSATDPLCAGLKLEETTSLEQGNISISATGYAIDAEEAESNDPKEVWDLLKSESQI